MRRPIGRNVVLVVAVGVALAGLAPGTVGPAGAATPTVTGTPTTGLPYRGHVTLHGRGLPPNSAVRAEECAGSTCQDSVDGTTDAAGSVDLSVPFRRKLVSLVTVNENGAVLARADCLQVQCSVRLRTVAVPFTTFGTVPIAFDPSAPVPPPPTLVVTPSTGLAARPVVGISGSGFFPNHVVTLSQCRAAVTVFGTELCGRESTTVSDSSGRISTIAIARRILGGSLQTTDCAASVGTCTFRATTDPSTFYVADPTEVGRVPLGFDPTAPLPAGPPVTVTPKTGLADRQVVTVAGSGFPGGDRIAVVPCRAAAALSSTGDCHTDAPVTFLADAAGAFQQQYTVPQFFRTARGETVDCGMATPTCALAIVDFSDSSLARLVPISFASHGPVPVVTIRSRSIIEPTGANHSLKVDVRLSVPTDHWVTASYEVPFPDPGTADTGDYSGTNGTVTFAPGQTLATARVDILGDARDEPDQWFTLHIGEALGATAGPDARITILDDDPPPVVGLADATVQESNGPRYALVPVHLDRQSEYPVTVHFSTHQFSARAGSDFVDTSGTLTIPPYWTDGTIAVVVKGDTVHEGTEALLVTVDTPGHATIGDGAAVLTITDDD